MLSKQRISSLLINQNFSLGNVETSLCLCSKCQRGDQPRNVDKDISAPYLTCSMIIQEKSDPQPSLEGIIYTHIHMCTHVYAQNVCIADTCIYMCTQHIEHTECKHVYVYVIHAGNYPRALDFQISAGLQQQWCKLPIWSQ